MKVIEQAINNRTLIVFLALILLISGFYSYLIIPKESAPSIDIPLFIVTTVYPGIGPSDMESLVTQPLERELQGIEGVDEIRSTTFEGFSTIIVQFDLEVENIVASQRVREQVDLARSELPSDAQEPMITEFSIDDFPIMTVNLAADYSMAQLTQIAERLEDALETIPGVREVDVIGGLEREVQVNVDLDALKTYNISFQQIIGSIQTQNLTIPGGNIEVDRLSYLLRVSGEFQHPDEISDLVVFAPPVPTGGNAQERPLGMVYMRDLAEVVYGFKDRESYARLKAYQVENESGSWIPIPESEIQQRQVVSLDIKQRSGSNILEISEQVHQILQDFPFPAGTQIVLTNDASAEIRTLISDLENSIISGMLFVVLVLVFFLGIRNALLVGTAVPLAIFVGFLVLMLLGETVNFVILFSLIIALGLLVDNSVVIVENIYRFRELGYSRFESARRGASEVGYALMASTATLVAAFFPMLFWPGIIGKFMSYFPMTLIIVLLSSLFIALVIYPTLTGFFVRLPSEKKKRRKARVITLWAMALVAALLVGLANPLSLMVSAGIILFFVLSYKIAVKPLSTYFTGKILPVFIEGYKEFLLALLQRDYNARYAYLRNMLALSVFTAGFLFLIFGGLLGGLPGNAASPVIFLGAILLGIGILGILIHSTEIIFSGGFKSVITGLIMAAIFAITTIVFSWLGGIPLSARIMTILIAVPLILVVVGLAGMFRPGTGPLILTDNRARLINLALGALIAVLAMFSMIPAGTSFFPPTDPNRIDITIEGPLGIHVDASNEMVKEIEHRIFRLLEESSETRAGVENVQINVGIAATGGFGAGLPSAERSRISLNMIDFADRQESSSLSMAKVREVLRDIPDVLIQVQGQEIGPPTGSPVNIEISGDDFDQVERYTREVRQILQQAEVSGAISGLVDVRDNVSGGLPEYNIFIDHEKARHFGLSLLDIAQTIRIAINGIEASTFRDGEEEYDIVVRLREDDRKDLDNLRDLTINQFGVQIPLVAVADFREGVGPGRITRLNLQRTAVVEADAGPGYSGPMVLSQVRELLSDYEQSLPAGYTMKYTGESEDQEESFGFLTTALMISFALIFLVLLAKFNSLVIPFIIMIAVGLSILGVFLGLLVTRTEFSVMVFVGIISLAGIVCINNIVLVEYIKQLMDKGMNKMEAIVDAGAIRLRPVLLTALTTILGLIPLTFGINIDYIGLITRLDPAFQIGTESTQFWGPMGITIISGLLFATFLTLVIVPVMYSVFDSLTNVVRAAYSSKETTSDLKEPLETRP